MYFSFLVGFERARGICVYAIKDANQEGWYHFRDHHFYLTCHSDTVRRVVQRRAPKRTCTVDVKLSPDEAIIYYDNRTKQFYFKTYFLSGVTNYVEKLAQARANREIGILKRKQKHAEKKERAAQIGVQREDEELNKRLAEVEKRRAELVKKYKDGLMQS